MTGEHRLINKDTLTQFVADEDAIIVDVSEAQRYARAHLPGAVHIDYGALVRKAGPVLGLLPEQERIEHALTKLGIAPSHAVVAYDDERGLKASRFLWTLDAVGHRSKKALIDGGLDGWRRDNLSDRQTPRANTQRYCAHIDNTAIADKDYILQRLGNNDIVLLDARSKKEYTGTDVRAARGGHIPGAVNVEWVQCLAHASPSRLNPLEQLRALYESNGITRDKEIICYCQSHRRSAHSYFVLKLLGYPRVKAYPGAWSEWGNCTDTPIDE